MGIRAGNNTKDQLRAGDKAPVVSITRADEGSNGEEVSLRYFTEHPTKPCWVDLTVFSVGEFRNPRKNGGGTWSGPFRGRPELIQEMAPAIQDRLLPLAEKSVIAYLSTLRSWWRILDSVEAKLPSMPPVTSTAHLTDVHRQSAIDAGIRRLLFSNFLSLVNVTRAAKGISQLFWLVPEEKTVTRRLPPQWQTDYIRHALKRRWLTVVERWRLADAMRSGTAAESGCPQEHARLMKNYLYFDTVVKRTGKARPSMEDVWEGHISPQTFYFRGLTLQDMLRGSYPDSDDIRAAFHLCLATTGWNPSVLLSLNINDDFLEPHPKDPKRYILRGIKARAGGAEQVAEGLFKTQYGVGFIIKTLVARTEPLRDELRKELQQSKQQLGSLAKAGSDKVISLRQRIASLEQQVSSVWLYVSTTFTEIQWLHDNNFAISLNKTQSSKTRYLAAFIDTLNQRLPEHRQLSTLKPTDLRDVYASYAYRASGGSILAVMKVLGHRSVNTTAIYLSNTLLKEEHRRLFSTFSAALWSEMASSGRVDPTVLAKLSREGFVTTDERARLDRYRTLMKSRIGVGCKDPFNPPRHIAPAFTSDGRNLCHVQRCTLCVDNAVIMPESLPGLSKRVAELRFLRGQMSVNAFQESSFLEELDNTELAILAFNHNEAQRLTSDWEEKISTGAYRVVELDGLTNEALR